MSKIKSSREFAASIDPSTLPKLTIKNTLGIYFLFDEDELVYVGMSDNSIHERLNAHAKSTKKFTHYAIMEIDSTKYDLKMIERHLITKHLPKYNNDMQTKKIKANLCEALDITLEELESHKIVLIKK